MDSLRQLAHIDGQAPGSRGPKPTWGDRIIEGQGWHQSRTAQPLAV